MDEGATDTTVLRMHTFNRIRLETVKQDSNSLGKWIPFETDTKAIHPTKTGTAGTAKTTGIAIGGDRSDPLHSDSDSDGDWCWLEPWRNMVLGEIFAHPTNNDRRTQCCAPITWKDQLWNGRDERRLSAIASASSQLRHFRIDDRWLWVTDAYGDFMDHNVGWVRLFDTVALQLTAGISNLLKGPWGWNAPVIDVEQRDGGGVNILVRLAWADNLGDKETWEAGPVGLSCELTVIDEQYRSVCVTQLECAVTECAWGFVVPVALLQEIVCFLH